MPLRVTGQFTYTVWTEKPTLCDSQLQKTAVANRVNGLQPWDGTVPSAPADLILSSLGTALRSSTYSDAILHICRHRYAGKLHFSILCCVFSWIILSSSWPVSSLSSWSHPVSFLSPTLISPVFHGLSSPSISRSVVLSHLWMFSIPANDSPYGWLCLGFYFVTGPPHDRFQCHILSTVTTSSALFRCLVR